MSHPFQILCCLPSLSFGIIIIQNLVENVTVFLFYPPTPHYCPLSIILPNRVIIICMTIVIVIIIPIILIINNNTHNIFAIIIVPLYHTHNIIVP